MENLEVTEFWRGKRVLVTGHTGFKGSWLSLWLTEMGAKVFGYALSPDTEPALFHELGLELAVDHRIADIRDARELSNRVEAVLPDVVLHLAAQPLVRRSYTEPLLTWQTNVLGTVNLLEAIRTLRQTCAVVIVSTDKVYQIQDLPRAYLETDRLGGHDPYSSSKSAVELAVGSWRSSYLGAASPVRVASARAGNVIGGGDWAKDRIVPDLVRALASGEPIPVRNPESVRPWQHVLEPLSGYLRLAQTLYEDPDPRFRDAFNFGPDPADAFPVRTLVEKALQHWPGKWRDASDPEAPQEAAMLSLETGKSRQMLTWEPRWNFDRTIGETLWWYQERQAGRSARELSLEQIRRYSES